jgi:oligopeptide/dipeptide ABC transporter ATP-binding protein
MTLSAIDANEFQFTGCRFHNRCPLVEDICIHERPLPVKQPDGRQVYCHFAETSNVQLESVE